MLLFQNLGCEGSYHAASKVQGVPESQSGGQETGIKESNMSPFYMKHAARAECYGRGMGSSLAYLIPEFNEKHAKERHVLLTIELYLG